MSGVVETKVAASTIAAALTGVGLWVLQTYAFHGDVPLPVLAAVQTIVPAFVTFAAGYMAPHTPRPDLREYGTPTQPETVLTADPDEVVPSVDKPVDISGRRSRHADDGEPADVPVRHYLTHDEIAARKEHRG